MQATHTASKPTIVLVHGAWADGTSWQHVIPLLERDGYTVVAVQNPGERVRQSRLAAA